MRYVVTMTAMDPGFSLYSVLLRREREEGREGASEDMAARCLRKEMTREEGNGKKNDAAGLPEQQVTHHRVGG